MQSEPWIIRTWQPCLDDSRALNEVLLAAKPRLSRMSPEAELSRTSRLIEGIEEGALLAFEGEKPVGAVILSILRSPEVAILMGGVKPGVCGRGLGRRLLEMAEQAARERSCSQLRARWFQSNTRAVSFVHAAGFTRKDLMLWSRFET